MTTPILAYHKIDDRFEWGLTCTPPDAFGRQMAFLREQRIQTVPLLQDERQRRRAGDAQGRCCITFDDAYLSVYEHALPVLERFGFTSAVFPVTGAMGCTNDWDVNFFWRKFRHMNRWQLRCMAEAGHTVGSHTVSHRDLTLLDDRELAYELEYSKKTLEDMLGRPVTVLSYPFGRCDARVVAAAEAAGYRMGVTMRGSAGDRFRAGRRAVYRFDSLRSFARKVTEPGFTWEDRKGAFINWCAQGTPLWRQRILAH